MARKPDGESQPEDPREERKELLLSSEHLGPLAIKRMSKDDGRALIVYRVAESSSDE